MDHLTPAERARFDAKCKRIGDCLIWQGPLDKDGYGTFFFRRRNRRAHRVSYFACHGDLPNGYVVAQTCENPACVSDQHIQAKPREQHAKEPSASPAYVNSQKTHCRKGHPYDRKYGKQRYCSICEAEKKQHLRAKWAAEDTLNI